MIKTLCRKDYLMVLPLLNESAVDSQVKSDKKKRNKESDGCEVKLYGERKL